MLLDKLFRNKIDRTVKYQSSLTLLVIILLAALLTLTSSRVLAVPNGFYLEGYGGNFPDTSAGAEALVAASIQKLLDHDYQGAEVTSELTERDSMSAEWVIAYTYGVKAYKGSWIYWQEEVIRRSCEQHQNQTELCIAAPELEPDHKQSHCPAVADPIIVATGNSFQTETDYQSQTPFGLNFVRFYNSSSNAVDKGMGKKWHHGFNRAIKLVGNQAQVARNNGQTFLFNLTEGNWAGDVDIPDTLIELVDEAGVRTGWQYQDSNDTVELFNVSGQLLSITNRAGQTKTFVYDLAVVDGGDDNSDTLDNVVGFGGEEMLFSYDSSNRITTMTDPEGNTYRYSYDDAGNLTSVTYPDDTPLDDLDNPTRTYHYENTAFSSNLTGLTDETGSRVTWDFDSEGRAISSELQGGVDKSSLDFSVADQVTVTNPLGKDTTYHFETMHGVKKVTQVEGHATESCAGANQSYTYDANGYIESKTDWQGNVTTYIHNERGLETSRTEASDTDESRTITTDWHDEFRLPIKVTSPGQVTDFIYDDKGRLTSQTTHDVQ